MNSTATPGAAPDPVSEPPPVLNVLLRDRAVHPYGIADVEQLWESSMWWVDGDAVVALLDLPGATTPVLYAISAGAAPATLALVRRLLDVLPPRFECTAPVGFTPAVAPGHRPEWVEQYRKMHLARPDALPVPDDTVVTLTRSDLAALEDLFATDPHAGDFFHAGLLDTGLYVGRRDGGDLVAVAGIHVIDRGHSVAAIGNVTTHPSYRRRGLARRVVATLCHRLLDEVEVVGLNVRTANPAALALYTGLGFDPLVPFEEGVFARACPSVVDQPGQLP